jgi:hypothetical protein
MLDIICIIWIKNRFNCGHIDLLWKRFRSIETTEKMSKYSEEEIKHRIFEAKLARLGAILLILGLPIQIIGYAINI